MQDFLDRLGSANPCGWPEPTIRPEFPPKKTNWNDKEEEDIPQIYQYKY